MDTSKKHFIWSFRHSFQSIAENDPISSVHVPRRGSWMVSDFGLTLPTCLFFRQQARKLLVDPWTHSCRELLPLNTIFSIKFQLGSRWPYMFSMKSLYGKETLHDTCSKPNLVQHGSKNFGAQFPKTFNCTVMIYLWTNYEMILVTALFSKKLHI